MQFNLFFLLFLSLNTQHNSLVSFLIQQFNCQPQYSLGNPTDFLFYGLKTYSFQRMKTSGSCILPRLPSKYFRHYLVNRRRFQPACCFTAGKSDARRNLLQPVTEFTSVQRMQTKLTPISSKGCVLIKILATIIMEILRISETDDL